MFNWSWKGQNFHKRCKSSSLLQPNENIRLKSWYSKDFFFVVWFKCKCISRQSTEDWESTIATDELLASDWYYQLLGCENKTIYNFWLSGIGTPHEGTAHGAIQSYFQSQERLDYIHKKLADRFREISQPNELAHQSVSNINEANSLGASNKSAKVNIKQTPSDSMEID